VLDFKAALTPTIKQKCGVCVGGEGEPLRSYATKVSGGGSPIRSGGG
jgi:hypothetical protein